MSEEQTTKLKKKTTVNWKQIQKTAVSVGLQIGMAFAIGDGLSCWTEHRQ